MEYDPVKHKLARLLGSSSALRRLFYFALDTLFLRAWYVHRELKRLKQGLGGSPAILDAGMGFGQYTDKMLSYYPSAVVTGLEIDKAHLYQSENYFRKSGKAVNFMLGDVQILPFADNVFDLVLTVDVMEHVDDDNAAFREFHRITRPGGIFIMHTPRDVRPFEVAKRAEHEVRTTGWTVGEHIRDGYNDGVARERLVAAGFRIIREIHGYGFAGRIAWTLLQRIPLTMLSWGKMVMALPVMVYLLMVIVPALLLMLIDIGTGDHPRGGSLLIVAEHV